MIVSTRGRYALRVLTDLAEHGNGAFIPLKEVAERQQISLKYLEGIMAQLSRENMVEVAHGKGGGYRLRFAPEEYRVSDILRVTEGSLAPVACLEEGSPTCGQACHCQTLPMWQGLAKVIEEYFNGYTLADLLGDNS